MNEVKRKSSDQLVSERRNSLRQIANGVLRPHGKLWGMDVFSWANPNAEELASTINSFPFPVIWMGNQDILNWMNKNEPEVWTNVKTILAYDQPRLVFEDSNFINVHTIFGIEKLEDALQLIQFHFKKGSVLLFTATDLEWERNYKLFTEFIEMHQSKA